MVVACPQFTIYRTGAFLHGVSGSFASAPSIVEQCVALGVDIDFLRLEKTFTLLAGCLFFRI